jgi:hypothetical protein
MITNGATPTREIKYRIAMAKVEFNKKALLYQQLGLNFKE